MITLRMLAIAVAILVGLPISFALADHAIGHVTVPGGEVFDTYAEVAAWVTDVELIEPPGTYDRAVRHNAPEQLVEGHTVFVTWDIPLVKNVTNWTANIIGNVECRHKADWEGVYWQGVVPVPTRVNEAHVECEAGETMIMTPDPFMDSSNAFGSSNFHFSPAAPTGQRIPFTAPNGRVAEAVEYEYVVTGIDWLGNEFTRTQYAWEVPILESWAHSDGRPRNWYCPIPEARLTEMGLSQFLVFHQRDAPEWLRFAETQIGG